MASVERYEDGLGLAIPTLVEGTAKADRVAVGVADAVGDLVLGIRILGVGPYLATADYGAANFVEVTRLPSAVDDI